MKQTDKKRAIVAKNVWNKQFADWINSQDAFRISLGPPDENVDYDLIISESEIPDRSAPLEKLSAEKYNRQRSWHKSGKRLSEWSGSPFHLGNEIIMATWICGKRGIEAITFFDLAAEETVSSRNDRSVFRSAMQQLVNEFDVAIRYTKENSQLFSLVGKPTQIASDEDEEIDPTPMPSADSLFANRHVRVRIKEGEILNVSRCQEGASVEVSGGRVSAKNFIVVQSVPKTVKGSRIVLADENESKKAIRLHGNEKEIYLLSDKVRSNLSRLESEFEVARLSVSAVAFLSFAMANDFEYIKTTGIVGGAPKNEARLLRSIAKGKNIRHD